MMLALRLVKVLISIVSWLAFFLHADASTPADLKTVAASREWLRLVHYMPTLWGGYKSELDGKGFFFAPDGVTNPEAELHASIEAFQDGRLAGKFQIHAQCAFPERFRFVREATKIPFTIVDCPKYREFLDMFHGPKSVSLVFSSAYPNNPASMFGHTFLKIKTLRKNDLLNMGINFAAYTGPDTNMLAFIYQGLSGGYRGLWSMEPYFTKVNEYVNAESRDLWEYDLSLTEEETHRLLGHVWELETNSHFDYYFFDENCSYQVLRAIEAIKPDWYISQHNIYVIPAETIKRLMEVPNSVADIKYRPSLFHQLQLRFDSLSPQEKAAFQLVMKGKPPQHSELTPEVLDAALLAHLYRHAKRKNKWTPGDQDAENKVIALRTQISAPARPLELPAHLQLTKPELGHDPYMAQISTGYLHPELNSHGYGAVGRLRLRSSYHDLLSRDIGFAPFTEIEFPSVELQWFHDNIRLYHLGLLNITSLFPLTDFGHQFSWRFRAGLNTVKGWECQECLTPTLEVGGGWAWGTQRFRGYLLGLGKGEVHNRLVQGYRVAGGLELGAIWSPVKTYKIRVTSRSFWTLPRRKGEFQEQQWDLDQSIPLGRNQEIRQTNRLVYSQKLDRPAWSESLVQWVQYFR